MTWIKDPAIGDVEAEHVDGVWWHDAPIPPRRHRCSPQSRAWIGLERIERCACGAIRRPLRWGSTDAAWLDRNSRKALEVPGDVTPGAYDAGDCPPPAGRPRRPGVPPRWEGTDAELELEHALGGVPAERGRRTWLSRWWDDRRRSKASR